MGRPHSNDRRIERVERRFGNRGANLRAKSPEFPGLVRDDKPTRFPNRSNYCHEIQRSEAANVDNFDVDSLGGKVGSNRERTVHHPSRRGYRHRSTFANDARRSNR